ncbi:hypothetical protein CU013_1292 [Enterococcus faecium]|nr:hypothetical protein [Enterococcus faecium]MBK4834955.1 hypothetical protein [Enterococcus faecium]MBK4857100.1 hypothetical protein [Enterococcus faecium]MBK4857918.1 hypothetical protein [Enterococcus faecium]MBK4863022.1 hypothetical protein [Enterococcus faecium]
MYPNVFPHFYIHIVIIPLLMIFVQANLVFLSFIQNIQK